MSRPLRIEFPGAFYHVMNRGGGRKNIFHNSSHYELFYDLLGKAHDQFKIEIHAFCLMSNHYHLLIRTPIPNLSKAMGFINGLYTQKYNKLEKTDGPLFRGRFKSILVEIDSYLMELSRYIHLNPVKAKLVQNPYDYRWSSYPCYLNRIHGPKWLYIDEILSRFSDKDPIAAYVEFINSSIDDDDSEVEEFYSRIKNFPILGSKDFVQKMHPNYVVTKAFEDLPEHKIIKKSLMPSPSIKDIIKIVANYFQINDQSIIENSNKTFKNVPRQVAIYFALKYSGKERREIANYFNGVSYKSLSSVSRRLALDLKINLTLLQDVENLKKRLSLAWP